MAYTVTFYPTTWILITLAILLMFVLGFSACVTVVTLILKHYHDKEKGKDEQNE